MIGRGQFAVAHYKTVLEGKKMSWILGTKNQLTLLSLKNWHDNGTFMVGKGHFAMVQH